MLGTGSPKLGLARAAEKGCPLTPAATFSRCESRLAIPSLGCENRCNASVAGAARVLPAIRPAPNTNMAAQLLSTNNEPPTKIQREEEPLEKPTRPPPPSPVKHDYKLVWADEFDYEGLPHPKRWGYQVEANNWVHDRNHNEQQWYMCARRRTFFRGLGLFRATRSRAGPAARRIPT